MGGGRKNLKRAVEEDSFTLQQGQALMQVLSLRGSNLIELNEYVIAIIGDSRKHSSHICLYDGIPPLSDKEISFKVMDAKGEKSLAFFPAKFQKSMWIKRGSYVVVDESGREEALESGSKVACIVSQVLFHEQVRRLQKTSEWPEVFKSQTIDNSTRNIPGPVSEQEAEESGSSDDGLPPLETNLNRRRPFELHSASNSDANTDTDDDS